MQALTCIDADRELVTSFLSSRSDCEASLALALLRPTCSADEALMLINLREVLVALPEVPFRTGDGLDILERAGGYESTGRSYRRLFESNHGVFGIEFVGSVNSCTDVLAHTPAGRFSLVGTEPIDDYVLELFVIHGILLDAVLEALVLLGCPPEPTIYLSVDDFVTEHMAAAASEFFG